MSQFKTVQVNGYKNKTLKVSLIAYNAMEMATLIAKMEQAGLWVVVEHNA